MRAELVADFIAAWKEEFSEELTEDLAVAEIQALMRFFGWLAESETKRRNQAQIEKTAGEGQPTAA